MNQLLLGIGSGNISGSAKLVTPVLGEKYIVILPFPVSHGMTGQITGNSSSQKISFNCNKLFKNTEFDFLSSYTHGYYNLLINGDAQLLFNLISTPVNSTLNYHAHFFDVQGTIKHQIGNINIIYSFNQIIPIIRRTDFSPIKFIDKEQIAYSYKHRDGSSSSINLQYNW